MATRHGFKVQANRMAVQIRADLGLQPTHPLDPWVVCKHLEVQVYKLSQLVDAAGTQVGRHFLRVDRDAFSGVVLSLGMHTAIVHNDSHVPVRQRSNLFHELAHLFLGHPMTPLLDATGNRDHNSLVEEEARFLGGCLSITNEAARHIVDFGLRESALATYQVSAPMLDYRLGVSGALQIAARRAKKRLDGTQASPAEASLQKKAG